MSCINCEQYAKRITNISKDDELKEKFENLTGLQIFQNIFLCETCEYILIQSFDFKEKCIEVFERSLINYEPHKGIELKQESEQSQFLVLENEEIHENDDEEATHEEYLDDSGNIDELDPLTASAKVEIVKPRVRFRYTLKEKLKAIEIAEKTSNRKAAALLKIDESCIRKWRNQKDLIATNANQDACSIRKSRMKQEQKQEVPEINDINIECEIQSELADDILQQPEVQQVKEVKTRKAYSSGLKLEVISFAEVTGNRQAAKVFNIDESCVRKWRNQKELIIEINRERGTKRKPNLRFPEIETRLKAFAFQKLDEGIILKPGEIRAESFRIASELNIPNFKGTTSYIFKFMERYHIPSKGRLKNKKK